MLNELDAQRSEVSVVLQVDHVQDASPSPRAHAEMQQHRLLAQVVRESDGSAVRGGKLEGRREIPID